ncbi:ArnT family glycosyltransferase [Orrella sp. 11846]|uniref:ArnT family glycosyltransferase n=1 Tax=Orrella sp. 11846 TaxID=3409913 RepID=UPI003B5956A0
MTSRSSSTPARLTALATTRLPRWALLTLVALYLLLGLFDRDPWKNDDVLALASAISAIELAPNAWLFPHLGSLPFFEIGPWTNWFNAFLIKLFSPFADAITAVRLGSLFWMATTLGALWYAVYLAGRRPESQPLALPFGGEPKEAQYGQLLADISVLFLIGTVGIVLRTHETSIAPVLMACQALTLLGALRLLDKPLHAFVLIFAGISMASLTLGAGTSLALTIGVLLSLLARPLRKKYLIAILICIISLIPFALWWWAVQDVDPRLAQTWWQTNGITWGVGPFIQHLYPLRDLPWFVWPTWPLAIVAIWNWRKSLFTPHIWIPTAFVLSQSVIVLLQRDPGEMYYIAITIPSAMLAAFSIPTLRRALVNALDWFALMYFSVIAITIWLGWFAQSTGEPAPIADKISRLTVGYDDQIAIGALAMSVVVTFIWIGMIAWRLRYHPKAAWRGAWLCATGLTSTWILFVFLWMPTIDYVRSYRPMSAEIQTILTQFHARTGQTPCIQASGINEGARASLYVFNRIDLPNDLSCPIMLQQTTADQLENDSNSLAQQNIQVLWTGSRGADLYDRFRLLQLTDLR